MSERPILPGEKIITDSNLAALKKLSDNKDIITVDWIIFYLAELLILDFPEKPSLHYSEDAFIVSFLPNIPLSIHLFYRGSKVKYGIQTFAPNPTYEEGSDPNTLNEKVSAALKLVTQSTV